jgi:hypothetical protein
MLLKSLSPRNPKQIRGHIKRKLNKSGGEKKEQRGGNCSNKESTINFIQIFKQDDFVLFFIYFFFLIFSFSRSLF